MLGPLALAVHLGLEWPQPFKAYSPDHIAALVDDTMDEIPDVNGNSDQYDLVDWEMEPGDVLMFHPLTLHGSFGSSSRVRSRRALALRWVGEDVRYAPTSKRMPIHYPHDSVVGGPLRGGVPAHPAHPRPTRARRASKAGASRTRQAPAIGHHELDRRRPSHAEERLAIKAQRRPATETPREKLTQLGRFDPEPWRWPPTRFASWSTFSPAISVSTARGSSSKAHHSGSFLVPFAHHGVAYPMPMRHRGTRFATAEHRGRTSAHAEPTSRGVA